MRTAVAVCRTFEAEARLVLQEVDLRGVDLVLLPPACGRPRRTDPGPRGLQPGPGERVEVFAARGCVGAALGCERCTVHVLDQCCELVAPPALVAHLLRSGAYLVTPGWLVRWRAQLDQLGLDAATAPALFGETMKRVVLLDTGAVPGAADRLRELAAFVGLPAEVLPVGVDHLRLRFSAALSRRRVEDERAESLAAVGRAHRRSTHYAAAFDLLGTLTEIGEEKRVIERALEVFCMLFAPREATFVSVVDGAATGVVSRPPRTLDARALLPRLRPDLDGRVVGADGFVLPVKHLDRLLGAVQLQGVAAPSHLERDLGLAATVAGVCGLAVANAREYELVKRGEEALREANARLVEVDQRKNAFLAMLSHELRNPLAPIRNSVYILERARPGGEQALRAREVIDRQARHLSRLVDDLLDVTRISRGKIRLLRERVELNHLVRSAGEDFRELFHRSGLELRVSVPDEPLLVDGDPTRLAQAIGNLLQNAAKFTPPGGHAVLSLGAEGEGWAAVQVQDDGAGIQHELLSKVFEPFVQADTTLDRSRGGLGLGLALVKGLVELHGGTVGVRSEGPGRGALFTLRMPLEVPSRPRPGPVAEPAGAQPWTGRSLSAIHDAPGATEDLSGA
ncbi:MAG: ATP-binding protein [Myxococcales bacterium]